MQREQSLMILLKRTTLLSLLLFLLSFGIGCQKNAADKLPTLVIGGDNYRPYNYTDEDGDPAGIDVDLAKEACRRIGYDPVFVQIDWSNKDELLESGKVDCLWSSFSMEYEKNSSYAWIGPYMYSRQVIAVLADSPIWSLSDLKNGSIAVKVSSKAESLFLEASNTDHPWVKDIYCFQDADEVVTALRNEYVDACAGYSATLIELFENAGVTYRFLEPDLIRARLGIAFSKDSDETLRKKLDKALQEMRADGTMEQILESYGLNADKALGRIDSEDE